MVCLPLLYNGAGPFLALSSLTILPRWLCVPNHVKSLLFYVVFYALHWQVLKLLSAFLLFGTIAALAMNERKKRKKKLCKAITYTLSHEDTFLDGFCWYVTRILVQEPSVEEEHCHEDDTKVIFWMKGSFILTTTLTSPLSSLVSPCHSLSSEEKKRTLPWNMIQR